jgi:hypothetical protein
MPPRKHTPGNKSGAICRGCSELKRQNQARVERAGVYCKPCQKHFNVSRCNRPHDPAVFEALPEKARVFIESVEQLCSAKSKKATLVIAANLSSDDPAVAKLTKEREEKKALQRKVLAERTNNYKLTNDMKKEKLAEKIGSMKALLGHELNELDVNMCKAAAGF